MHKHAKERIKNYEEFLQSVQHWQFGHPDMKRTCLWLRNLPALQPTNVVDGRQARVHRMPPGRTAGANAVGSSQGLQRQ